LWDTTSLLPTKSLLGSILHVLIGYESAPSGMQILFYAGTLAIIIGCSALVKRHQSEQLLKPTQA
jgi:high-affinity iron transporter